MLHSAFAAAEIKPEYKRTEVGIIPNDWKVVSLGEIGSCLIGLTYSPSNVKNHGTLVLRSSNIQNGTLTFEDNVYVDSEIPERIIVQEGDILICVRNGSRSLIGKCALLDQRVAGQTFGAFMSVFRTPDSAFVFHQFQSSLIKRQIDENIGATINQITNANLNAFKIPFPTDPQERITIARAMSDIDTLINSLDQLITKKRDIQQATMQQLLTGQRRLPGFSGEWKLKLLGDIANLYQPVTISAKQFTESGYPVYGANGVVGFFPEFNHDSCQVIVTCRGSTCGTVNRTVEKSWITGNSMVINCDQSSEINKNFLYFLLLGQDLSVCITGTGQPQIVRGPLASFELPIPKDLEEQIAIATILSDIESELLTLEARRNKARHLKKGMMQNLLSGKIRLRT